MTIEIIFNDFYRFIDKFDVIYFLFFGLIAA